MKNKQFLEILEQEANRQAALEKKTQLLPKRMIFLASFFVRNMWRVVLILSAILALVKVKYL